MLGLLHRLNRSSRLKAARSSQASSSLAEDGEILSIKVGRGQSKSGSGIEQAEHLSVHTIEDVQVRDNNLADSSFRAEPSNAVAWVALRNAGSWSHRG